MKTKIYTLLTALCFSLLFAASAQASTTSCSTQFTSADSGGVQFFMPSTYNPVYFYTWSFGDGTSGYGAYPTHQYTSAGAYMACLTVYDSINNCNSTWCDSVVITNSIPCSVGITQQVSGMQAILGGYSNVGNVTSWAWTFGDGGTASVQYPNHTYQSPGTYNVCVTINTAGGCTSTNCTTVTVTNVVNCNAQYTYVDSGSYVYFMPSPNNPSTYYYYWNFGDGTTSTSQYPIHQYNGVGPYGACLTVIDSSVGCSSTWCDTVFTSNTANCNATFSAQISGSALYLYGQSNVSNVVSWQWTLGDGQTSSGQNPSHNYAASGTYTVCLTITTSSGCTSTICHNYTISTGVACNAQFYSGDSTGYVFFMPVMTTAGTTYLWSFGDGTSSTQQYPIHQYNSVGPWTVCLTVATPNNCTSTWCDTVSSGSSSPCSANFVYTADSLGTVAFTNLSTSGSALTYYWYFGDGTNSTVANPVHAYSTPGTYLTCLTIYSSNNCQASYCDTIILGTGVSCVPTFYSYPDSTYGNGNVNFGIYNGCPGYSYYWSFGDSTTSSGTTPIHLFNVTGWYVVCCTAVDPNGNSTSFCDSIFAFRVGHFTGISEVNAQLPVQLYPNPTSGPATVKFHLNETENVIVDILSIDGKVCSSTTNTLASGDQELKLNVADLTNGLYFIRLKAGNHQSTVRMSIAH